MLLTDGERSELVLTLHHLIADGWSLNVLAREFAAAYRGEEDLPVLTAGSHTAARAERTPAAEARRARQREHWTARLTGRLPRLRLPYDRPRSDRPSARGAAEPVRIPAELADRLAELARAERTTMYVVLLAGYLAMLHRRSRQRDLLIGTPVAGRTEPWTEPMIGFFANTLVLRTNLSGDPTFRELVGRAREVALDAFDHAELPFDELVRALAPDRDLRANPLFSASFALQSQPVGPAVGSGIELDLLGLDSGVSRFDLECHLWESAGGVHGSLLYRTELFDSATVARFVTDYLDILGQVADDSDIALSTLAKPLPRLHEIDGGVLRWRHRIGRGWEPVAYVTGAAPEGVSFVHVDALLADDDALAELPVLDPAAWEARLRGCPGVTDAAVVRDGARLVGYVAPRAVADRLVLGPLNDPYGTPTTCHVVGLDTLPNRATLAAAAALVREPLAMAVAERSGTEQRMAALWREVLNVATVEPDASFFALGGHSLLAVRLLARVRDEFGVTVPVGQLFAAPTVRAVAAAIDAAGAEAEPVQDPAQPDPARRYEPFPLTDIQQAYWVGRTDAFDLGGVGAHEYFEYDCPPLERCPAGAGLAAGGRPARHAARGHPPRRPAAGAARRAAVPRPGAGPTRARRRRRGVEAATRADGARHIRARPLAAARCPGNPARRRSLPPAPGHRRPGDGRPQTGSLCSARCSPPTTTRPGRRSRWS